MIALALARKPLRTRASCDGDEPQGISHLTDAGTAGTTEMVDPVPKPLGSVGEPSLSVGRTWPSRSVSAQQHA